jgi:hypothetical protein
MTRKSLRTYLVILALGTSAGMTGGALLSCGGDTTGETTDAGGLDATTGGPGDGAIATRDGSASDDGGSSSDAQRAPGGACATDLDCLGDQECLFPTAAACGSTGTCTSVPENGPGCAEAGLLDPTEQTSCACDGTARYQPCALPAGYTRGNILHPGSCADGGQVCDPQTSSCPAHQICGFRVADGCSGIAYCFDAPDPTIAIPGVLENLCGCDGGVASTYPDTSLYVSSPARGPLPCSASDAGADADSD